MLDKATKRMGLAVRLRQGLAPDLWPRVVGPEIARVTQAGPVREGELIVRTDNPVLAHQLSLMSGEILARYRGLLGNRTLRRVRVQVAEIPPPRVEPRDAEPEAAALPAAREEELRRLAGGIPDPDLAAAFLRAARAWAARVAAAQNHPRQNRRSAPDGGRIEKRRG